MAQTMKQTGSRNMGCAIEQMQWSNKMDLIAFGTEKGEVIIQRLNWQKIMTFPAQGENIKVRSLSWQLDETVLAVAYSNGKIALLDAEIEDCISSINYEEGIKKLYFTKAINVHDYRNSFRNHTELTHDFYLPPLPPLSGISSNKPKEQHKSLAKGSPCFLVVLLESGKVQLLLLGALKAGSIDLSAHVQHKEDFEVHDVQLSSSFTCIYALLRDGTKLKLLHFQNDVLQQYLSPLLNLSVHCANVWETKNYINDTIQLMLEAWETVLIEMDNKLTKYANAQPEGALSADFLELLLFGYATQEIEDFLMDDLTEKGLKKLANSVDLSCSTMQTLVSKPLQCAATNMFYFLNIIKGLGRISYFFEPFINYDDSAEALSLCGALLIKILELQQVIDQCVSDMKLFFCWLCVAIVRLHQQSEVTEEYTPLSAEDTIYLAEYLNSFEDKIIQNDDGSVTKRKFNLEKVGQYLENKPLQQVPKTDAHHLWNKLLEENECVRNCALLYPHDKKTSLLQQLDKLLNAIELVFNKPNDGISANFVLTKTIDCCKLSTADKHFALGAYFAKTNADTDLLISSIGRQELLLLEFAQDMQVLKATKVNLRAGPFTRHISPALENLSLIDMHFYNEKIASLLLRDVNSSGSSSNSSQFLQFPLDALQQRSLQIDLLTATQVNLSALLTEHSIHDLIESSSFKKVDGICTALTVSGSRKVATTISENNCRMTIFEMEVEEDEDETDISQNSLLEVLKDEAADEYDEAAVPEDATMLG